MPAYPRMRHLIALPLLAFAVLAALFSFGPVGTASADSHERKVQGAARVALKQLGDPYKYGANGPNAFDCSGLLQYSFKKAGMRNVPRTSDAQARAAKRISKKNLRPGDLMVFSNGGDVYHIGMFLKWKNGKALMVHSPRSGENVQRSHPWTSSWYAATLRR